MFGSLAEFSVPSCADVRGGSHWRETCLVRRLVRGRGGAGPSPTDQSGRGGPFPWGWSSGLAKDYPQPGFVPVPLPTAGVASLFGLGFT